MGEQPGSAEPRRLAAATTMQVGGEVATWVEATTRDEVAAAYAEAIDDDYTPLLLLGGGSNTVASSEPFDGTVLHVATRGIRTLPAAERPHRPAGEEPLADDSVVLRVEAGEGWDALVAQTVADGLAGLDRQSGHERPIAARIGEAGVGGVVDDRNSGDARAPARQPTTAFRQLTRRLARRRAWRTRVRATRR